ncbi:MAG: hypothetical protein JWQ38_2696 [Flavipsychrobacter sp.]|nr:hypothetical protein [Flavipsychrobacter sp.]
MITERLPFFMLDVLNKVTLSVSRILNEGISLSLVYAAGGLAGAAGGVARDLACSCACTVVAKRPNRTADKNTFLIDCKNKEKEMEPKTKQVTYCLLTYSKTLNNNIISLLHYMCDLACKISIPDRRTHINFVFSGVSGDPACNL